MTRVIPVALAFAIAAPAIADEGNTTALPDPLPTPDFTIPEASTHTLSNGVEVRIVENHEVPLFDVRVAFKVGSGHDPADKAGLASVTFDLMDDGAGDLSSEAIARRLKQLGSSLSTSASLDVSSVNASGLVRNLDPTLDLLATVVQEPTFPADEWEILQAKRVADARAKLDDPSTVGREAFYRVLYDGTYQGASTTPESYAAITADDIRDFHARYVAPNNAVILVGGDVTPETILPILEARFGSWTVEGAQDAPAIEPVTRLPETSTLYFIDKPGAAQSVVRVGAFVGTRTDDDYYAFHMGNTVLGGAFTARLNMNLREDKGYTYGARCNDWYPRGPGVWFCAANVQTAVTGPALTEFDREIRGILTDTPVTSEELEYFQSSEINGFPGQFETVGALLDEARTIWTYDLPEDWVERYVPGVESVTVEAANQALHDRVDPEHLVWLVVGDRERVWDDLSVLGLPIVELNRDGTFVEGE